MHVVVCGHITRDLIAGEERLGGAASFAACAAHELGVRTSLLTAAPENCSLLTPLRKLPGLTLHVQPSAEPTTFELTYSSAGRKLRLHERAEALLPSHVPSSLVGADVAYVAPVIAECGADLVKALGARQVAFGLQGLLRVTDADGVVRPKPESDLDLELAGVQICIFSVEDHPEAERISLRLASAGKLVALTRAERGLTLYSPAGREEIAAAPANEIDPTGAGDVFGIVFALSLAHGRSAHDAAVRAAEAAARVVEGPGLGRFPNLAAEWQRNSTG